MSLAHGRSYLAIPGPSVIPDRVLRAMQRPAPNIYEGELSDVTASLIPDLRALARTEGDVAIYIANGHGIWEAALSNVASRGGRVLAAATGRFCEGWAEMAEGLHLKVEMLDFGYAAPIDPERVADALRADKTHEIRAVLACHVDTSSSVRNDIAALSKAMRATGHPALLMVDGVASLGCETFEMDKWGADVLISASQKGMMTPPGVGFIWFNARAAKAHERADLASVHWDWTPRAEAQLLWQYFGGTAPTHHLYGLRAAMDMINEEGLEQVWDRHARLAQAIWAAIEAWGQGGSLRLNLADPGVRSHAVTTLHLDGGQASELRAWCERETGVTLGIGLGFTPPENTFRIGHMGHVNAHMVLGALGAIEAGMIALDIAHGAGGLSAAAKVISGT